ncbi:hypothetical protein EYF80_011030 [Liparis tanakae]|uniref:Uncharacterized protein n=1 Tax=Liparis tanakae TaxID=230148 RepID=A0A4Z2ILC8_9TELE|nr:hypothetical protein EYF80_011030 [Liparis tanakae]
MRTPTRPRLNISVLTGDSWTTTQRQITTLKQDTDETFKSTRAVRQTAIRSTSVSVLDLLIERPASTPGAVDEQHLLNSSSDLGGVGLLPVPNERALTGGLRRVGLRDSGRINHHLLPRGRAQTEVLEASGANVGLENGIARKITNVPRLMEDPGPPLVSNIRPATVSTGLRAAASQRPDWALQPDAPGLTSRRRYWISEI